MAAYDHQMEREISAQSLTSRGGSEIGGHYTVETGIYMSSFAAAIFVASLATVGVLLITILFALTIMLRDCQSKSAGIVELWKYSDDYIQCKISALHAELNSLGAKSVPHFCKHVGVQYIKKGQYMRDLNITATLVEDYLNSAKPLTDGLDVVLMDADDFILLDSHHDNLPQPRGSISSDPTEEAEFLKHVFSLQLYMKLHEGGWPLILFSRKSEKLRKITEERLISAGYVNWSSLIMRLDDEMLMSTSTYISGRRKLMERQHFRIKAVISSQMDALSDQPMSYRAFKIPNPVYFNTLHHTEII
ncbi:LIM domain-containing family protein [Heracleum sosnowskyi]|uniref:LIM domain-containing family protein n=1 Tax=Heracleum sosnowskyi TaxID=360622 RepID=A0AAD8M9W3_9APIA|nr:LIM domain-containing family protein [Heracleum sosnowskyi]